MQPGIANAATRMRFTRGGKFCRIREWIAMRLHERLACLRREKGLTQAQLAEAVQVSRQAVSRWETGA